MFLNFFYYLDAINKLQISTNLPLKVGHSVNKGFFVNLPLVKNQKAPIISNELKIVRLFFAVKFKFKFFSILIFMIYV